MTAQTFTVLSFIASITLLIASIAYFFSVKRKVHQLMTGNKGFDMQKHAEEQSAAILADAQEKAKKLLTDTEFIKKSLVQDLDANLQRIASTSLKQLEDESQEYNNQYKELFATISHEHTKMLEQVQDTLKEIDSVKAEMLKQFQDNITRISVESTTQLETQSKEYNAQYKQLIEDMKAQYLKKAEETIDVIEKIPEQELKDYQDMVRKETLDAQESIGKQIGEELGAAQKEVQEYKDEKMKEVGDSVDEILHKVTKDVLAESLSEEEHKKLIVHALEQAKTEGILSGSVDTTKSTTQ
jgi:hypothetical protein